MPDTRTREPATIRIQRAVAASSLPAAVRSYLVVLALYVDDQMTCWPSCETIAADMGLSVSRVKQLRSEALELGIIRSRRRRNSSAVTVVQLSAIPRREVQPAALPDRLEVQPAVPPEVQPAVRREVQPAVPKPPVEPPERTSISSCAAATPAVAVADVFPGEDQPDLSLTSAVLDRMTRACTQRPSRARVADVVAATWPAEWPADAEPCDRHRMAMAGLDVALAELSPAERMPHRVAKFAAAVISDAMAAGVYPEPEAPKPHVPSWQREQAQKREQATAALYALLKADA